jgi:hypothetical protein
MKVGEVSAITYVKLERTTYISPTTEPMLTMSPDFRFAMCGTTTFETRRMETVFKSKVCLTKSRSRSSRGPT